MSSYPIRKSPRVQGHDYFAPGGYFVTICTDERRHLFGEVRHEEMLLNGLGHLVHASWAGIPERVPGVVLDEFKVLPNHVHGILVLQETSKPVPLGEIVRRFKSWTTRVYRVEFASNPQDELWQRNYYEHGIRSEQELQSLRTYTLENAKKWESDSLCRDR